MRGKIKGKSYTVVMYDDPPIKESERPSASDLLRVLIGLDYVTLRKEVIIMKPSEILDRLDLVRKGLRAYSSDNRMASAVGSFRDAKIELEAAIKGLKKFSKVNKARVKLLKELQAEAELNKDDGR